MKLLIDTHVFIWWESAPEKLSSAAKAAVLIVASQQARNGVSLLPITEAHVYDLPNLGTHHRDPFDRLLVAQARTDGATCVPVQGEVLEVLGWWAPGA